MTFLEIRDAPDASLNGKECEFIDHGDPPVLEIARVSVGGRMHTVPFRCLWVTAREEDNATPSK